MFCHIRHISWHKRCLEAIAGALARPALKNHPTGLSGKWEELLWSWCVRIYLGEVDESMGERFPDPWQRGLDLVPVLYGFDHRQVHREPQGMRGEAAGSLDLRGPIEAHDAVSDGEVFHTGLPMKASTIRAWAGATALALPLLREHLLGGGVRADHDPVLDPLFHEGKEAPDTLLLVDCVPDDGKLPLSLSSQEEAAYSLRSCSEAEVSCITRGRKP
jgi:hypothetical protein